MKLSAETQPVSVSQVVRIKAGNVEDTQVTVVKAMGHYCSFLEVFRVTIDAASPQLSADYDFSCWRREATLIPKLTKRCQHKVFIERVRFPII